MTRGTVTIGVLGLMALALIAISPPPVTTVPSVETGLLASLDLEPDRHDGDASLVEDGMARRPPFTDPDRAGVAAYAEGRYADALSLFAEAIARNPADAESHSNLGQTLVRLGRPDEAVRHLERAVALNPSRWVFQFNLAFAQGERERWDLAVDAYRAAATLAPDQVAVQYNLGRALRADGDHQGAVRAYQRAVVLEPDDPRIHLSLGLAYEAEGEWAAAVGAYERYLALAPAEPDTPAVAARVARLSIDAAPATAGASGRVAERDTPPPP